MDLTASINTFGSATRRHFGERAHKVAINAGFSCPNRDGSKGRGGCTFCNNASFSQQDDIDTIVAQINSGRKVIADTTRARLLIAYFQAYTNTYGHIDLLRNLYDEALAEHLVVGLSVGTRPDCCPNEVLDLLAEYQDRGHYIWLELGLQSSFDNTLAVVNRGHGFSDYLDAVHRAKERRLRVCTHLIAGLPGETGEHVLTTLNRVLENGVDGLKLHPLHVVTKTVLAHVYRKERYRPLTIHEYIETACNVIEITPRDIIFHRLTGTAPAHLLLAPNWCSGKWKVLNAIGSELLRRGTHQGIYA